MKRKATTQVTFQTKRIIHLEGLGKAKRTLQLATKYMQKEGYEPQEKLIAKGPEEAPRLAYPMRSTHTPTLEDVQGVMADTTEALREAYS